MADDSGDPGKSKDNSDLTRIATVVTIFGTIIAALIGLQTLTGVSLRKIFAQFPAVSTAPTPTAPSTAPVPTPTIPTAPSITFAPAPTFSLYDPPAFTVQSSNWSGPCNGGCRMTAIFLNTGGAGSGTATFHVYSSHGVDLADCSIVLPKTAEGAMASGGCNAFDIALRQYFISTPGAIVHFRITIDDAYSP